MYDFHYNHIMQQYPQAKMLFTDTDSLCYSIETQDIYSNMKLHSDLYDFSAYPRSHPLYDPTNKKVLGKMKDELNSVPMSEFLGIRSKMYSFRSSDGDESKKAKGIKKDFVKRELSFNDYYKCVFQHKVIPSRFNCIRSRKHKVYSASVHKVALSPFDDKRYLYNATESLAYGHYKIYDQ